MERDIGFWLDECFAFAKVALQNAIDHAIMRIFSSYDGGLEQEQNSLRSIAMDVILSEDLMDKIEAEPILPKVLRAPEVLLEVRNNPFDSVHEFQA